MPGIHKSLTLDRVMAAASAQMFGTENPGFCIACGEDADGCEPDSCNYPCEVCGENKVFGASEIMLMCVA